MTCRTGGFLKCDKLIIFVVSSHEYSSLLFPVCKAACPRGMCGMYSFVLCWFSRVSFLHCLLESPGRDGWLGNEFERLSVTPCGDFLLLCESKQMDSISWRDGWARGNVCVKPRKHPLIRKMFFTVWLRSCQSTLLNQNTLPYSHTHFHVYL